MPILNSVGALKEQNNVFTVIPVADNQWIAELNSDTVPRMVMPSINGNVYCATPSTSGGQITQGLFKLNGLGSVVSQFNTADGTTPAGTASVICVDNTENVYVGGGVDASFYVGTPNIIKYNKNGNILWQKYLDLGSNRNILSIQVSASHELFVLMGGSGGDPSLGNGPYVLLKMNPITGAIINQRELLKYTTSATTELYIDNTNNEILVAGTDYQTHSEILIGTYDASNTGSATNIVYQSSATDDYQTYFSNYNQSIVADSSYIYQVAYYVISGITRSVYLQIDRTTGSVAYSNRITVGGSALTLNGISMDDSGNIYVTGSTATTAGYTFIMQIDASTGSINWIKALGSNTTGDVVDSATWSRGFLYFSAAVSVGATLYYSIIKLKDDGSVADGTYGSHWTFSTPTPTLVSTMPDSTGTTTGSNNTTSYTATNTSLVKTSSSLTTTIYNL